MARVNGKSKQLLSGSNVTTGSHEIGLKSIRSLQRNCFSRKARVNCTSDWY